MPKYQIIKDIKIIDHILLRIGDEVELNVGEPLKMNTPFGFLELSFDSIQSSLKEKETIEVTLTELEDEDTLKEYRLQLDVKTTRRKAREIEKYLRETLDRMI